MLARMWAVAHSQNHLLITLPMHVLCSDLNSSLIDDKQKCLNRHSERLEKRFCTSTSSALSVIEYSRHEQISTSLVIFLCSVLDWRIF